MHSLIRLYKMKIYFLPGSVEAPEFYSGYKVKEFSVTSENDFRSKSIT